MNLGYNGFFTATNCFRRNIRALYLLFSSSLLAGGFLHLKLNIVILNIVILNIVIIMCGEYGEYFGSSAAIIGGNLIKLQS